MSELAGKIEIGYIAGEHVFGRSGAQLMAVALAVLLISTVSAMTLAGPRVLQVIGEDYPLMGRLARKNRQGIPALAIGFQSLIAMGLVLTATFESILVFTGSRLGAKHAGNGSGFDRAALAPAIPGTTLSRAPLSSAPSSI